MENQGKLDKGLPYRADLKWARKKKSFTCVANYNSMLFKHLKTKSVKLKRSNNFFEVKNFFVYFSVPTFPAKM